MRAFSSSISWAKMPRLERKTARRGRSAVPDTLPRMRRCRRSRASRVDRVLMRASRPFSEPARRDSECPCPCTAPGGRTLRISAAVWPTTCLSVPLTTIWVGIGTSNETPGARRDRDRVRVADGELEVVALELRAVADALDLEMLLEALRDALDHVGDERAGEAVQRAIVAAVGRSRHVEDAVLLHDLDAHGNLLLERAERPLDVHLSAGRHLDGDAARNLDWLSADPAHGATRRTRALRRQRRALRPDGW